MEQQSTFKLLSLWQPWATLIALRLKQYETRSWTTPYRGKLAIQATKRRACQDELAAIACNSIGHLEYDYLRSIDYPLGAIVCVVDLADCLTMSSSVDHPILSKQKIDIHAQTVLERAVGHWESGRYAWTLDNIIALPEPIPYRGSQGLRDLDESAIDRIQKQIGAAA